MPLVRDEAEFEAKRQLIMQGALKVFAERGFERATNKAIAEAAGIGSPGLIYHYFKDKGDLLIQAVSSQSPDIRLLLKHDQQLFDLPLEQFVQHVARTMVGMWSKPELIPVFKVMLGEALRNKDIVDILVSQGPGVLFRHLYHYFALQIERGAMRPMDPGVAVRSFLGPLLAYLFTREVIDILPPLDAEVMLQQGLELFLRGVKADT
jgi:AcrR family transcriptional regulator